MTRRRRWLIVLAVTLFLFEGLYLAAANYMLNSDRIFELINRKPEKFWIHWDSAWTLWPGMARRLRSKHSIRAKRRDLE